MGKRSRSQYSKNHSKNHHRQESSSSSDSRSDDSLRWSSEAKERRNKISKCRPVHRKQRHQESSSDQSRSRSLHKKHGTGLHINWLMPPKKNIKGSSPNAPHKGTKYRRRHSYSYSSSSSHDKDSYKKYHKSKGKYKNRKYHRKYSSPESSSLSNVHKYSSLQESMSESVGSSTLRRRRTPHFKFKIGQKIGHKYRIQKLFGDGTFGRVVQATKKDKHRGKQKVAIKIIRPVQKYVKSAKTERSILHQLMKLDQKDQHGLVRYIQSFYHLKHFCLVFKPLGRSLYEVIKNNACQGFPIKYVQSFARQIFSSIAFLHQHGYTHTDLKPQNILLQSDQMIRVDHPTVTKYYLPASKSIRIIDFGSATHYQEHHSSIINTRQYRSPEVLLQSCEWNEISDVWSIGCILAELFTGELLFQTHSDNEHLLMMAKNCGPVPPWMAIQCDNNLRRFFKRGLLVINALSFLQDPEPLREFKTVAQLFHNEVQFEQLLSRCLEMDPKKRINCKQALNLPFFKITYSKHNH